MPPPKLVHLYKGVVTGSAYGVQAGRGGPDQHRREHGPGQGPTDQAGQAGALETGRRRRQQRRGADRCLPEGLIVHLGRSSDRPLPGHRDRLARSTVRRCSDTPKRASTSRANTAPDIDVGDCCR